MGEVSHALEAEPIEHERADDIGHRVAREHDVLASDLEAPGSPPSGGVNVDGACLIAKPKLKPDVLKHRSNPRIEPPDRVALASREHPAADLQNARLSDTV